MPVEFFVEFKCVVVKYEFNERKDGGSRSAIVRSRIEAGFAGRNTFAVGDVGV